MKSIYNPQTKKVEEQPEMKEPFYDGGAGLNMDKLRTYNEQKALCKTYDVRGAVPEYWLKGEVLEEWLDFELLDELSPHNGTNAVPMKENKEPKSDKLWEETVEKQRENCGTCGSKKVWIRGRYPKDANRLVCPTCTYERLEQINEMSNPNYHKTYESNK